MTELADRARRAAAPLAVGAMLYECRVFHARLAPLHHAFSYRTYQWLVDLDELPRPRGLLRPLADFRARDHLGDPASTIRANVDQFLGIHGVNLGGGQVLMLAHARVLGCVFNPLTVYWCHQEDGTLACVIAEVHNTYGQRHAYLVHTDERGRARVSKEFYVSPFHPVDGSYRMTLPCPAERLMLNVTLTRQTGTASSPASGHGGARHRASATARRRAAPVVHVHGVRADQVAGDQVVRARAAAGAATAAHSARGGSVTSTQHATAWVIDPEQWPDVATVHGSAAREEIARVLFRAAVSRLPIRVRLPGGRGLGAGSPAAPVMVVHNPAAFFTRLGAGGLIGFGESTWPGTGTART